MTYINKIFEDLDGAVGEAIKESRRVELFLKIMEEIKIIKMKMESSGLFKYNDIMALEQVKELNDKITKKDGNGKR